MCLLIRRAQMHMNTRNFYIVSNDDKDSAYKTSFIAVVVVVVNCFSKLENCETFTSAQNSMKVYFQRFHIHMH